MDVTAASTTSGRRIGLTLASVLASGVAAAGSNPIVTQGGMRLDYPQLVQRIHRLGDTLTRVGARPGTRVAWLDRDTHRYLEAYFAVPMLGATLMTANIRLSAAQLRYTLEHSQSRVVVTAAEFLPLLEQALQDSSVRPRVVVIGRQDASGAASPLGIVGELEALMAAADPAFTFPAADEASTATLFYTTGTTGLPKGVSYTQRQLVEHTLAVGLALAAADDWQSLRGRDVYMPLTPMFHVHAWGMPYIATLLGLKQVYPGRYDPQTLPALITQEGVTFSHGVPTVLQMVLEQAETQGRSLPGWKVMVGGSALAPALAARATRAGILVFAGYGMSETCPVVCFSRADAPAGPALDALCRAGRPVPLLEARVLDPVPAADGARGELGLRAPWLTQGYVGDEAATARLWDGGWLHTADVAVIDADGAIRIVDRLKDVIKSGGEWVSSLDLEARLRAHPDVDEAAVIGVPDAHWGERPCAYVRRAAHCRIDDVALAASLRELLLQAVRAGSLPKFAVPQQFRFVDEIPKTSVGKLDKKRLREAESQPQQAQ